MEKSTNNFQVGKSLPLLYVVVVVVQADITYQETQFLVNHGFGVFYVLQNLNRNITK